VDGERREGTVHCKKRLTIFPSPAGTLLTKISLAGNILIVPGQGEFGIYYCINASLFNHKLYSLCYVSRSFAGVGMFVRICNVRLKNCCILHTFVPYVSLKTFKSVGAPLALINN
jgi:hypothetical protein